MNKIILALFFLVVLTVGGSFFLKDIFSNNYTELAKQILAPGPLRIGGKENSVILTKAQVIAQTNLQRRDNGDLTALKENSKLNAVALAKANGMFAEQYFEHNSPSGVDPGELVKKYGYEYIVSGENLILGNFADEKEVVQKWMDSPGHRANILNKRFTQIGVAMVKGTYEGNTVWIGVQEFGLPLDTCPAVSETLKNQVDAGKADLDTRTAVIDTKKQQIENTEKNSPGYNALVEEYNTMVAEYNTKAKEVKSLISEYNKQINNFNACVAGT